MGTIVASHLTIQGPKAHDTDTEGFRLISHENGRTELQNVLGAVPLMTQVDGLKRVGAESVAKHGKTTHKKESYSKKRTTFY